MELAELTGTVYDRAGSVIPAAKVIAKDSQGKRFPAITDEAGVYSLRLPACALAYSEPCKTAKYEISVEAHGFEKLVLKHFRFVSSSKKKMFLDLALEVGPPLSGH